MARFNLEDYETVEQRIKRLYELYEDARIETMWVNEYETETDPATPRTWVVKAWIYLTAGDQANKLPKATGYASEIATGPQAQWSCELAETSAIGRALANMNLSGNKRASREEMQKVQASEELFSVLGAERDWLADAKAEKDVDKLRKLYLEAKAAGQPTHILKEIEKLAKAK